MDSPEKRRAKGRAFLAECGGTAAGVRQSAEEVRPWLARLAKKWALPPDQFEKECEREARQRPGNPVQKLFAGVALGQRRRQTRADVRRALLAAALAVKLDGEGALKKHPDPVGGGPFEYAAFDGGFELRSKWKGADGKPVALTVGRRGK